MTTGADDTAAASAAHSTRLVLLALFGASFHFLWDMPNVGGMPFRLGASDVLLLVFLGLAVLDWRSVRAAVSRVDRAPLFWLGAVAVVILLAFLRGPRSDLTSRSWATVKVIGFFVLVGYFLVGLVAASKDAERRVFIKSFVFVACACSAYALVRYCLAFWGYLPADDYPRLVGFAQNANAFGLLTAVSLIALLGLAASGPLFPARLNALCSALLLLALYLCASRGAAIAFVVGALALAAMKKLSVALLARSAAAAAVIYVVLLLAPSQVARLADAVRPTGGPPSTPATPTLATGGAPGTPAAPTQPAVAPGTDRNLGGPIAIRESQYDVGVKVRLFLAKDALRVWRAEPLLGAGLGGFLREERRLHANDGSFVYVNHNSGLWILSEMGVVGLIPFVGFFLSSGAALFMSSRRSAVAGAVVGVLVLMATASLGGEVIYQRYLWVLLGVGLADVAAARPSSRLSSQPAAAAQGRR